MLEFRKTTNSPKSIFDTYKQEKQEVSGQKRGDDLGMKNEKT